MKKVVSLRAGIVLQLTLIAVASLSLLAVFALRAIEITLERRHVEAAVSVAEVVRQAVAARGGEGGEGGPGPALPFSRLSPYILDARIVAEAPSGGVSVVPVGERTAGILSLSPTVDVTLSMADAVAGGGTAGGAGRGLRVRFHSPGVEREARTLLRVAGILLGADVVALVLFGFFLMERSVVGPLRRLAAVSERIASGDLRLRADETPANEVGQLGASFNRMVAAILAAQESARRAQRETFQSEKLATVGRLAAGVAHEVGNPLMAVRGYAEYLRRNRPPGEEQAECLDKILAETRRIEQIVRGLLSAVSPEGGGDGTADVNSVVAETVEILSFRRMFRDVEVRVERGDAGTARISPERFRQVLLNLMINAVDAMEKGGVLGVRTFRIEPWIPPSRRAGRRRISDPQDADFSGVRAAAGEPPPRGVGVSVEDTGCGIPPEELSSIFDPFYTSKEPGRGTGLGLSVSRAIVEAEGGEILCESEQGKGSRFTVILPAAPGSGGGEAAGEGANG